MPKMTDFGSQKGAQREPKSTPKPTKIEDKNRRENKLSSRPSWSRFGTILGHFVTALGAKNLDFSLVFQGVWASGGRDPIRGPALLLRGAGVLDVR